MSAKPKERPKIVWCKPCNGDGWCMVGEVPYECMCGHLKRVASGMPPYIKKANVETGHVHLAIVRQGTSDAFVEASWSDMRAVVKILLMTGTNGHVRITDDREIRDVYVGSMARAAKSKDYDGVVYNNISDLAGPPDLLLIRLNVLSNKNIAAAGALEEAIKLRMDYGKPTWLLSDLEKPYNHTAHSYSEDVGTLIADHFPKHVIPRINKADEESRNEFFSAPKMMELEGDPAQQERPAPRARKIGHDPEAEPERKPRKKRPEEDSNVPAGLSVYGSGVDSSKSKFRKS